MADDKLTGFLAKDTAGLPNWAWIVVLGAGIAAAYIVPNFLNKKTSSSTSGTDTSGIGLAVDPTTGLPYAVEGLVPGGGTAGGGGFPVTGQPIPAPAPAPAPPGPLTIQVGTDVPSNDTLQQIAQQYGLSLQQLYSLNPWLGNPNASSFPSGGSYNPNLPGNVAGTSLIISSQQQAAALRQRWPGT